MSFVTTVRTATSKSGDCQSALNIDPVSASSIDPLFGVIESAPGGDAWSRGDLSRNEIAFRVGHEFGPTAELGAMLCRARIDGHGAHWIDRALRHRSMIMRLVVAAGVAPMLVNVVHAGSGGAMFLRHLRLRLCST